MRVQTEEWCKFVPGVRMYKGKKTLFYNGSQLIDSKGFPLLYSKEERETWEVVILLPGVEVVPSFAFTGCVNLKIVIMNDDVKRLEEGCFYRCLLLVYISFSRNLQFIGRHVFYRCYSLTSLNIPSTCRDIDVLAFDGCGQLIMNGESNSETANEESTNETLNKDVEIKDLSTESKHEYSVRDEEESYTDSKRRKTNHNQHVDFFCKIQQQQIWRQQQHLLPRQPQQKQEVLLSKLFEQQDQLFSLDQEDHEVRRTCIYFPLPNQMVSYLHFLFHNSETTTKGNEGANREENSQRPSTSFS